MSRLVKYGLALCVMLGVVSATGSMLVAARAQRQLALAEARIAQEREREARLALATQQDPEKQVNAAAVGRGDPNIIDVDHLPPAATPEDVERLKHLRVVSAKRSFDLLNTEFLRRQIIAVGRPIEASEKLLEAELALAKDRDAQLKPIEASRDRLRVLLDRAAKQYKLHQLSMTELSAIEEAYYKAQIRLAEMNMAENAK